MCIRDRIRINGSITNALVFDEDGIEKDIVLEIRSQNSNDFVMYQNEPNPWSSVTNIRFDLPKEGRVNLKISNGFGVVLEERVLEGVKGSNTVTLEKNTIDYTGLLIVDMEFEGKHQIRKMIKF